MKKWIFLFVLFSTLTSLAQSGYNYSFTDPCTLATKSIFVPTGSGVVVNYFDNYNTFTSADFSSGVFDAWVSQVSQQNTSSPCSQVTTIVTNNVNNAVVANTVSILTNIVAISSLAQSMTSISSSIGSTISPTTNGALSMDIGNSIDNNQSNSNGKSDNKNGGDTGSAGSNQTNNQNEGSTSPSTTTGGNTNPTGGTDTSQGGNTSDTNQPTQGGEQKTESSIGASGSTANSISNIMDGGSNEGGGTSSSSKKQANAKTSSGSLIASGDMVAISNADGVTANQYKIVGSLTHANTRGTRIKGVLFNFTTGVNNVNVTLYKSYINKAKTFNTIIANSTMMDFDRNIFNTTTALDSYKVNKNLTGMFGLNFTVGKMGERKFYNLSAVGGSHVSTKISNRTTTSFLILAVYSPFTQFYDGKWWSAGVLFVPFNSWDFKITKTFKYNVSLTGVYQMNDSFLNYQILTGGKISF